MRLQGCRTWQTELARPARKDKVKYCPTVLKQHASLRAHQACLYKVGVVPQNLAAAVQAAHN